MEWSLLLEVQKAPVQWQNQSLLFLFWYLFWKEVLRYSTFYYGSEETVWKNPLPLVSGPDIHYLQNTDPQILSASRKMPRAQRSHEVLLFQVQGPETGLMYCTVREQDHVSAGWWLSAVPWLSFLQYLFFCTLHEPDPSGMQHGPYKIHPDWMKWYSKISVSQTEVDFCLWLHWAHDHQIWSSSVLCLQNIPVCQIP